MCPHLSPFVSLFEPALVFQSIKHHRFDFNHRLERRGWFVAILLGLTESGFTVYELWLESLLWEHRYWSDVKVLTTPNLHLLSIMLMISQLLSDQFCSLHWSRCYTLGWIWIICLLGTRDYSCAGIGSHIISFWPTIGLWHCLIEIVCPSCLGGYWIVVIRTKGINHCPWQMRPP